MANRRHDGWHRLYFFDPNGPGCVLIRSLVHTADASSPRSVISRRDWSSTRLVYSLKISYRRLRVACCSLKTASGLNRCGSPSRRHWYSPPVSSRR